jgi:hypothetical protein
MLQNYIYIHSTVQDKLIITYCNFDFYSISKKLIVEVRQHQKQIQSIVAETVVSFILDIFEG